MVRVDKPMLVTSSTPRCIFNTREEACWDEKSLGSQRTFDCLEAARQIEAFVFSAFWMFISPIRGIVTICFGTQLSDWAQFFNRSEYVVPATKEGYVAWGDVWNPCNRLWYRASQATSPPQIWTEGSWQDLVDQERLPRGLIFSEIPALFWTFTACLRAMLRCWWTTLIRILSSQSVQ